MENLVDKINNYDKIYSRKFNKHKKRQLSMTNSHLNIFKDFYHNKNSKYAIICEDDIIMHKEIGEKVCLQVEEPFQF